MNLRLDDKRAVVTGASGGIGEALARALAREGAHVLVHGRRQPEAERVAGAIRAAGARAGWATGDLGTEGGAQNILDAAAEQLGGIDILVNNAGTYDFETSWETLTPVDWKCRFNENVVSAVRLIRVVLPAMKKAGWGRVINISSTAVAMPPATLPEYSASKAALANLTLSLARDCARTGVTANSISPGIVLTPGIWRYLRALAEQRGWAGDDEVIAQRALEEVFDDPPGGWGDPADVARVGAFLASPLAGWINGSDVRVDGGETPVA
jgi:NAD(P)-dependent dehydrogenase (short-subunit alcohol dehydrogenase family)